MDFHVSFPDHSKSLHFSTSRCAMKALENPRSQQGAGGYGREINETIFWVADRHQKKNRFNKEYNYKISIIYLYLYI